LLVDSNGSGAMLGSGEGLPQGPGKYAIITSSQSGETALEPEFPDEKFRYSFFVIPIIRAISEGKGKLMTAALFKKVTVGQAEVLAEPGRAGVCVVYIAHHTDL